jgi:transcriptional/translational regulatory protein YebC/TACO1
MEAYQVLTNEEKATSIRSKIKSLQYQKYSFELDLIAENAISEPNQTSISEIQKQIDNLNDRQAALQSELDSIS